MGMQEDQRRRRQEQTETVAERTADARMAVGSQCLAEHRLRQTASGELAQSLAQPSVQLGKRGSQLRLCFHQEQTGTVGQLWATMAAETEPLGTTAVRRQSGQMGMQEHRRHQEQTGTAGQLWATMAAEMEPLGTTADRRLGQMGTGAWLSPSVQPSGLVLAGTGTFRPRLSVVAAVPAGTAAAAHCLKREVPAGTDQRLLPEPAGRLPEHWPAAESGTRSLPVVALAHSGKTEVAEEHYHHYHHSKQTRTQSWAWSAAMEPSPH
jgi:hypothetical protein